MRVAIAPCSSASRSRSRAASAALVSVARGFVRPADFPEIVRDAIEADVP